VEKYCEFFVGTLTGEKGETCVENEGTQACLLGGGI